MKREFIAVLGAAALWLPVTDTWVGSGAAQAAETETEVEEESESVVPLGSRARAWMQRQRDGSEQSRNPHGLTAPEEHRSRTRYLDSYTHPIPALFDFEKVGGE